MNCVPDSQTGRYLTV